MDLEEFDEVLREGAIVRGFPSSSDFKVIYAFNQDKVLGHSSSDFALEAFEGVRVALLMGKSYEGILSRQEIERKANLSVKNLNDYKGKNFCLEYFLESGRFFEMTFKRTRVHLGAYEPLGPLYLNNPFEDSRLLIREEQGHSAQDVFSKFLDNIHKEGIEYLTQNTPPKIIQLKRQVI